MNRDGSSRTVLVTGGTRGIGRAVGIAFARTGARVVLTHRWGSADPAELAAAFQGAGAREPEVVAADVSSATDTRALMEHIGAAGVDVFVSNVSVVGRGTGSLSTRDLKRSLDYSAWPLGRYLAAMGDVFGRLPSYVVAMSSDGADHFYPGYDYVASAKSVLEALCRRLAERHPDLRINALRARQVDTGGYREMFGEDARDAIGRFARFDLDPDEVARVATALCSGDLDGLSGEVVTVDRGAGPLDNLLNVAPALLGGSAVWETAGTTASEGQGDAAGGSSGRPRGVLWVDAGVSPGDLDFCRPVEVVTPAEASSVSGYHIPECVVLGSDWRVREDDEVGHASLLLELMERAAHAGLPPRYGLRVERGIDPPAAGEALGRALDRYWGGWRVGTESRLNSVRYTDDRHHPQAIRAARALLSGALDGMRGQVLEVTREARL
jgi:NAD(P)-dependent dehydrogenase (short-subunit alcohol dehydrogenase family)